MYIFFFRQDRYDCLRICIGEELHSKLSDLRLFMVSFRVKHCLVTKHVDVLPCGHVWTCLNGQNVLQILTSFKFHPTGLNRIEHEVKTGKWVPWNNVWSCLITKHFPFGIFFSFFAGRMWCNRMWTFKEFCSFRNRGKPQWQGISFDFFVNIGERWQLVVNQPQIYWLMVSHFFNIPYFEYLTYTFFYSL